MKQVNNLGSKVIKGEKATRCIFVKPIFETDKKGEDSRERVNQTVIKFYSLFNTEQCTGLAAGSNVLNKTGNINFYNILVNYRDQSGITYVFGTD